MQDESSLVLHQFVFCFSLHCRFAFVGTQGAASFELDTEMCSDDSEREALQEIINNTKLSEGYLTLARDIEVMEPKSPEDIYKVQPSLIVFVLLALSELLHLAYFPLLQLMNLVLP